MPNIKPGAARGLTGQSHRQPNDRSKNRLDTHQSSRTSALKEKIDKGREPLYKAPQHQRCQSEKKRETIKQQGISQGTVNPIDDDFNQELMQGKADSNIIRKEKSRGTYE